MKLQVKEQIKTLLAQEDLKLKELAELITNKTGQKCSPDSLSHKLRRGSLTYNDAIMIFDLLGYDILLIRKKDE